MGSRYLYQGTADQLASDITDRRFFVEMQRRFSQIFGRPVDSEEVESWRNSIPTVVERLTSAELGGVQVLLEMSTPITDIRMDMVLVGSRPGDGRMSVVVVENKQWSMVAPHSDSELVRLGNTRTGPLRVHRPTKSGDIARSCSTSSRCCAMRTCSA
ncbi:hypothetical protein [Streptomonospora arabica]|uniref:NERD domain-containing protein n=1 Tax=Streptomonospora arabica TaxID=412417 RepID=A0ABV9ST83_9ACTN